MSMFNPGDKVLHEKSGNHYHILDAEVYLEETNERAYVYRGSDFKKWVRRASEMEDGRFTKIG